MLAFAHRRVAEARQVDRDDAKARGRERLEVLRPHPAIGDSGMQEHDRGAASDVVVRQHQAPPVKRMRERIAGAMVALAKRRP